MSKTLCFYYLFGPCSLILLTLSATRTPAAILATNCVADTTLQEAFPTNNLGGGDSFTAGTRLQGGRTRALLRYDVSGIPAGATVNSVSLSLTVTQTQVGAVDSTFALHPITAAWGEGNGGAMNFGGDPATVGEASWNDRLGPGTPWMTAGGDFLPTASATQTIAGNGTYIFTSAGLAADVQSWVDNPNTNQGWLLLTQSEGTLTTIRRFAGRLAASDNPMITVDYRVSATATSPVLTNIILSAEQFIFSFDAEVNRSYTVEFRNSLKTGAWATSSNIASSSVPTTHSFTNAITGRERYFRVRTP